MLMLAAHDPAEHVLPHRFFALFDGNLNFGAKTIPLLNIDFGPAKFYFTNHLLMTLVSALLCLLIFPWLARSYAATGGEPQAPRGAANLFETLLQFIRESVVRPILGPRTDGFIPYLWTLFFFILFCNLLGMIPLDSIIYLLSGRRVQHIGGTATGNLAVTGGLALCSLFAIHVSGVVAVYRGLVEGAFGHHDHGEHAEESVDHDHAGHSDTPHATSPAHGRSPVVAAALSVPLYLWGFAPHVFAPQGPRRQPGAVLRLAMIPVFFLYTTIVMQLIFMLFGSPMVGRKIGFGLGAIAGICAGGVRPSDFLDCAMWAILFLLECIGAVIKPFALMIRLFANMIAGHIVLASILALIFIVGTYTAGVASALGCIVLSCLELFVALLQAYIFVFLTSLFIGAAVAPEH